MDALKNTWYPAAWSKDVGTQLLKRTLLNESIVFFRIRDGAPVALANMCPHRFAPLHLGKLIDDTLQCGYHGLRFNAAGKCVFNPDGDGITPPAAKVRSYPLHERYGLLWIWIGRSGARRSNDSAELPVHGEPRQISAGDWLFAH